MSGDLDRFEEVRNRLSADPAFAPFLKEGVGLLVWDAEASRIIAHSRPAAELAAALTDGSGKRDSSRPARDRLMALAAGRAPVHGYRLERLRLVPDRLAGPITFACRRITLESGPALVTAVVGTMLEVRARPMAQASQRRPSAEAPGFRPRGTVRFIWQADSEMRFTSVSPELADVVGPMAADIVGRTWDEIARSVVRDLAVAPQEAVAALLARRETFSGRPLAWQVDNTGLEIPVDFAGMPVLGPDRSLLGYRGFSLLRTDAAWERPSGPAEMPLITSREDVTAFPADSLEALERFEEPAPAEPEPDATEHTGAGSSEGLAAVALEHGEPEAFDFSDPGPVATAPATLEVQEPTSEAETPADAARSRPESASGLSTAERNAFREIARALGARFAEESDDAHPAHPGGPSAGPAAATSAGSVEPGISAAPESVTVSRETRDLLDRLPTGIIVHRSGEILFANRLLLDLAEFGSLDELVAEGGLPSLFRGSPSLLRLEEVSGPVALSTHHAESIAVEVRHATLTWDDLPAGLMLIRKVPEADPVQRLRDADLQVRRREARVRELESILDTATDGVILIDETGRILSLNRSAEALFGYDQREVVGDAITVLLAPESHIVALDYMEGLRSSSVASLLNDGREVMGRVRQGGTIPLFMTLGHAAEGPDRKFCAVLRDITAFKKTEGELVAAKRAAEEASAQKSDLLAKISHEIRTPLNAIIGFAEVMLEERFGPIGNERYKDYLKDVHASGAHVISLVNDLLDLAKIEAGRLELTFATVNLNDLVMACVTLLQPQASRDRIVMRTSFAQGLPAVVADERSIRQIALNLVSNAIKFTDAGGQVIVSTARTDRGEVAFRVRDTGIGMSEEEIESALEPFRQLATARRRGGTGLGLPLTKALVEANRGAMRISSHPNEGTLVEVLFPPARVLAGS